MLIQVFITTFLFAANILPFLGFALLAVLYDDRRPIRRWPRVGRYVHRRSHRLYSGSFPHARVQPDGWVEAKMPTSAMLAASIVAGVPTLVFMPLCTC